VISKTFAIKLYGMQEFYSCPERCMTTQAITSALGWDGKISHRRLKGWKDIFPTETDD
jgi:hypothetical protein